MTEVPASGFHVFRKRLMFWLLILFIATSMLVKYINLLLAYAFGGENGYIEDVAGMSLAKFVPSVSWEAALGLGLAASLSVLAAMAMLSFVNRLKVRAVFTRVTDGRVLNREVTTYTFLFVASGALGVVGVTAANTLALLTFSPLIIFALLNPDWGRQYARTRVVAAFLLGVSAFGLTGSKTIIFNLLLAFTISALYRGRRRGLMIGLVLAFIVLYPYFNTFRAFAAAFSAKVAFLATATQFSQEFATFGPVQLVFNAYSAILNRLVGLDGLLVATRFDGLTDLTTKDIAFELVGYEGIGISLGLLGQLYVQFGDIGLAALVFPFVIVATWRLVVLIDTHLSALGFASIGTLLYVKAIQILVGGFRWVDMKVTGFAVLAVLVASLVWYMAIVARRGRRRQEPSARHQVYTE